MTPNARAVSSDLIEATKGSSLMSTTTLRRSRTPRALLIGLALAGTVAGGASASTLSPMQDAGGPGGSGSSAVVDVPEFAQTSNQRTIELTESKEAPGGILAGGEESVTSDQAVAPFQTSPNVSIF